MRRWLTGDQPAAPAPASHEQQLAAIRSQRAALQRRADATRTSIDATQAEAARYGAAGQRAPALDALRRKAVLEREYDSATALARSLDQQLAAIETATMSASVASSLHAGAAVMSSVHKSLDVAAIERSQVDFRTKSRETDHAVRLMTRPIFEHGDDDRESLTSVDEQESLDRELSALMQTTTIAAAPPPQSTSVAVAPVTKTTRELESELGL